MAASQKLTNRHGLALRYHTCLRTIDKMVSRGILPKIQIGRFVRFDIEECDMALKSHEIKSVSQLTNNNEASSNSTNGHGSQQRQSPLPSGSGIQHVTKKGTVSKMQS